MQNGAEVSHHYPQPLCIEGKNGLQELSGDWKHTWQAAEVLQRFWQAEQQVGEEELLVHLLPLCACWQSCTQRQVVAPQPHSHRQALALQRLLH